MLMIVQAGYNIAFQCPGQTSMLLHLNLHPSRVDDLRSPDTVGTEPNIATSAYFDHFGNRVTRVDAPLGVISFKNDFRIYDAGLPDEIPTDAPLTPVARLPDEALLFLIASRYCDNDNLLNFAWSKFSGVGGGAVLVKTICDFVHLHIEFSYARASPFLTASGALREVVGVCRDFAHRRWLCAER
jgi:transglutaminase-like putative cysteine protease